MKCKNCGNILNEGDKFCGVCGAKNEEVVVQNITPANNENVQTNYSETNYQNTNNDPNQYGNTAQNINQYSNNNTIKKDDNETACLICGILSFFTCWVGIILGIIAIVLGSKIKKESGKMPSGMICGIISVSIYALLIIVYIAIIAISLALGV